MFNCNCKCSCTLFAVIGALIIGIIAAFLQITGVIVISDAFLWVVLGIAVVYLAVLALAVAIKHGRDGCGCDCLCSELTATIVGILGAALFAVVILGVGLVAESTISAILAGLLLFFLALTVGGTACIVKCLANCDD